MRGVTITVLLLAGAYGGAAFAQDEEIIKTPAKLEFEAVTTTCEKVVAPHVVQVKILGECALIGVQPLGKDDRYYRAAFEFVRGKVHGEQVRVEVCPDLPLNDKGQNRAVIYYRQGEAWYNLSIELIAAGWAKVADVPGCHVPTKGWLEYEKEARLAKRGRWADLAEPGKSRSDEPDLSDFD